jgi:YegS/Rv2252/BmrU family lipid kinase
VSTRYTLLVNPAAASGRALNALPAIRAEFDAQGADYRVVQTASAGDTLYEARAALDAGATLVACGGDGLVGSLAGLVRGTDAQLGVIPCGRGNDLGRVLEIPTDPAAAARVVLAGRSRRIDLPEVNGIPYVGIASLGFDSEANRIANEAKLVKGNLVYLYAALKALAGWEDARFVVTVDGQRHEATGSTVAVANNKAYGGGMFLVPHAELDDGKLDVFWADGQPKLKFLAHLPKVFKGTHVDDPGAHFLRGEVVEVSADRRFTVYADGDAVCELPITVRIAPRALGIIVP